MENSKSMKRVITTICFSLTIFYNLFAQNVDSTNAIVNAEEAYKNQDYQTAISLYESIINDGYESADLLFNLGNAYFKSGELAKSLVYYEKAKLLAPNDKDIEHNLAFAYSQQPDNIEQIGDGFLVKIYQTIYRVFTVDTWAIIGIFCSATFCVCLCLFLFSQTRNRKKIALTISLCSLLIGTIAFCSAQSRYSELTSHEYAIVIEPTTSIKTEPMLNAMDLATIHGGLKVKVIDEAFGWLKISLGNGNEGWIIKDFVERI